MHAFTDNLGRSWDITITVAEAADVKAACGVNLYGLVADDLKPLLELLGDPVRLIEVLDVVCRPQIEARGLDRRKFMAGFAGDALGQAVEAFREEVLDFFGDPEARRAIRSVLAKAKQVQQAAVREILLRADQVDPASLLRATSNGSSGGVPASSASTPAPTVSGSSSP